MGESEPYQIYQGLARAPGLDRIRKGAQNETPLSVCSSQLLGSRRV